MNRCSLEDYSFRAGLRNLERAWDEMQLFQRQLREFRNAQGDLRLSKCAVTEILERLGTDAREQLPGVGVELDVETALSVMADGERLEAALRQVINNACRELKRRSVASPRITLTASRSNETLVLCVGDNALPEDEQLIAHPFDQDASAYRRSGEVAVPMRAYNTREHSKCRPFRRTDAHNESSSAASRAPAEAIQIALFAEKSADKFPRSSA